jgi:glycosyltransferase involved in cell wall biosynthesis
MKNLVVIPAYNEEHALPDVVADLHRLAAHYDWLIVNDGSTDGTRLTAERLARASHGRGHLIHLPHNCGIGVTVQTGYLFAAWKTGYEYVIQFDGDGQHDAGYVETLVDECRRRGLDLCIGSRFIDVIADGFRSTAARRAGIRLFCVLIGSLAGTVVTDPTSGFRCAGPRAWKSFAQRYPDDYPEPESLFWCLRNGLRVGEVGVRMRERQGGVSSIRRFRALYYMTKVSASILIDRLRAREYRG